MPKRLISFGIGAPLLDIASYARRGPSRRDRLSPVEIEHISLTARRVPEVMVKVLSRGGQDLRAVRRHLDYLRFRDDGELKLETDDGQQLTGPGGAKGLLEDWDLDLQEYRRRLDLEADSRRSAKLVHKLMFSMPAGTPPEKVLTAVKHFAREEFGFRHRYVMALHTDEPHPHVHLVVKAVSEQGVRLHIRKATLREWRHEFARDLRALGVPANATERAVRGESRQHKLDGVYRTELRGDSRRTRQRVEVVAGELVNGNFRPGSGKAKLLNTRHEVHRGWNAVAEILKANGQPELAARVKEFVARMKPPRTTKELLARHVLALRQHSTEERHPPAR
jgi:type IV secretory pathway VirD2 relaxase